MWILLLPHTLLVLEKAVRVKQAVAPRMVLMVRLVLVLVLLPQVAVMVELIPLAVIVVTVLLMDLVAVAGKAVQEEQAGLTVMTAVTAGLAVLMLQAVEVEAQVL